MYKDEKLLSLSKGTVNKIQFLQNRDILLSTELEIVRLRNVIFTVFRNLNCQETHL